MLALGAEIVGKDACGALYLGGTGALFVVFGRAGRGYVTAVSLFETFQTEDFGADETAVLGLGLGQQFLHHLVASRLALAVRAFGLSAVEPHEHHYARHGSAHHAQPPHPTAKAGGKLFGHNVVEPVEVGKGCHHALAAAIARHEVIHGTGYSFVQLCFCQVRFPPIQ